jgi:hypothetical protein
MLSSSFSTFLFFLKASRLASATCFPAKRIGGHFAFYCGSFRLATDAGRPADSAAIPGSPSF